MRRQGAPTERRADAVSGTRDNVELRKIPDSAPGVTLLRDVI